MPYFHFHLRQNGITTNGSSLCVRHSSICVQYFELCRICGDKTTSKQLYVPSLFSAFPIDEWPILFSFISTQNEFNFLFVKAFSFLFDKWKINVIINTSTIHNIHIILNGSSVFQGFIYFSWMCVIYLLNNAAASSCKAVFLFEWICFLVTYFTERAV